MNLHFFESQTVCQFSVWWKEKYAEVDYDHDENINRTCVWVWQFSCSRRLWMFEATPLGHGKKTSTKTETISHQSMATTIHVPSTTRTVNSRQNSWGVHPLQGDKMAGWQSEPAGCVIYKLLRKICRKSHQLFHSSEINERSGIRHEVHNSSELSIL